MRNGIPWKVIVSAGTALVILIGLVVVATRLSCDDRPVPSTRHPDVAAPVPKPAPSTFPTASPGTELARNGDEIMVAGRLFRTGTRVVLWTDPKGYDAYRTERRFSPWAVAKWAPPILTPTPRGPVLADPAGFEEQPSHPARVGIRDDVLNWSELEQVRGGAWPLELLQQKVDQFVLHYDVVGTSQFCFRTLHDDRGLSVHFLLDIDGTIYQTMDLKDRAFHATSSNHRSVGIEIAHRGAYASDIPLREFYAKDADGPYISLPARFGDGGVLVPGRYRPARVELVRGNINGENLVMYDFTPQQYDALTRLTATLATVLPRITLDYPKDAQGNVITRRLPDSQLTRLQGLVGHFHIQDEKYDPGPAFDWDRVTEGARALMTPEALTENRRNANNPVREGPLASLPPPNTTQPSTRAVAPPSIRRDAKPAPTRRPTTPPRTNTPPRSNPPR